MNHFKSLFASSLLISSTALAAPITVKDWNFDDSSSLCVASTNRTVDKQTYRLELSFDKSGTQPLEMWVREVPVTATTRAFRFVTETKPVAAFSFAPIQDANGSLVFWQIPSDTEVVLSYLKRQTRFLVQALTPNGAASPSAKAIDFSLRGSSAAIDALISQCNGDQDILQSDFEKSFVSAKVGTANPLQISESQTKDLRDLYKSAVAANAQKALLQKNLADLNSQYAKQIQELAKVTGTLDQLTQKELATLQMRKKVMSDRMTTLDSQIADAQAAVAAKESEVVTANAAYDRAWQSLAPLEPEHKRLGDMVNSSQKNLDSSENRLSDLDDSIENNKSEIKKNQAQADSSRQQLSQLESQVNSALANVNATDLANQRFDARREQDERLFDHPAFRYCREEGRGTCDNLAFQIETNARAEVDKVRSRLSDNSNDARSDFNQLNTNIAQTRANVRDLLEYKIPNLNNQLADLRSQRPSLAQSVSRYENELGSNQASLQSYELSVGYAAKKAAVTSASAAVVGLQKQLPRLESARKAAQAERAQKAQELVVNDGKIQDVLTKIQAGQSHSSELKLALAPYFVEKTRIQSALDQQSGIIASNKQAFEKILVAP